MCFAHAYACATGHAVATLIEGSLTLRVPVIACRYDGASALLCSTHDDVGPARGRLTEDVLGMSDATVRLDGGRGVTLSVHAT
jgi:hypothetical protein